MISVPASGGCICGNVRYEITQAPFAIYACHCRDCQRITSSVCSIGVIVPDAGFRLTAKEARLAPGGVTENGRTKNRWICPDCGTWLFGSPRPGTEYPGMTRVIRGGTLDDTSSLKPTTHYWTRSKQPWVALPPEATVFATQPDRA